MMDLFFRCAKIGDLGLAKEFLEIRDPNFSSRRMASDSLHLRGTSLYWCPNYVKTRSYTPASDVYSFGIVAAQLICFIACPREAVKAVEEVEQVTEESLKPIVERYSLSEAPI